MIDLHPAFSLRGVPMVSLGTVYLQRPTRNPYARARFRAFATWSRRERKLRFGRFVWARHGGPANPGVGYSASLSLSLVLRPWALWCWCGYEPGQPMRPKHWQAAVLGFRLHYQRSYGGWQ